jgi:hypothetical protein
MYHDIVASLSIGYYADLVTAKTNSRDSLCTGGQMIIVSPETRKTVHRNILQRFLSYAHTAPAERNLKWIGKVKRDIQILCETSALFDLSKQWQEYPIVPAPSLQALWRDDRLNVSIASRQVSAWMTQIKDSLDQLYPKQFERPDRMSVSQWILPVKLFGIKLLARVAERQAIERKSKKQRKVFNHIRVCYVVEWPHIFWFAMAELFEEFASDLMRCTECRKLFLKTKRQGYCSSACRIIRWRREHPLRVYEIRRKAYVGTVHKKLPGAKVQRRGPRLAETINRRLTDGTQRQ